MNPWFKGFLTPCSIDTVKRVTCKKVFKQGSMDCVLFFVKAPGNDQVLHVLYFWYPCLLEDLGGRDELLSVLQSGEQTHGSERGGEHGGFNHVQRMFV